MFTTLYVITRYSEPRYKEIQLYFILMINYTTE